MIDQETCPHELWRDAWFKNSNGTKHMQYCVRCQLLREPEKIKKEEI